jgi:hypothetical protein
MDRRTTQGLLILACTLMLVGLGGCAEPPAGARHREIAQGRVDCAIAVLVWLPAALHRPVWLQFEEVDGRGNPVDLPSSVFLADPEPAWPQSLPTLEAWHSYLVAFPARPGTYALSRWVGEIERGRTAVSNPIGWRFEVTRGAVTHLGQLMLHIEQVTGQKPVFTLRSRRATREDLQLLRSNIEGLRTLEAVAAPELASVTARGTATDSGTAFNLFQSSMTVYVP